MKIAFLNIYSGINNRGAESFAHELAGRLSEKNEVLFLKADKKTWLAQPQHSTSLLKRFFLDSASLSVLLFSLRQLPILLREKPDVMIPMNGFWQLLLCKLIAIFTDSKIVVVGHSGPGWDEMWNLFLNPDVFVATTEPTANWAKKVCSWTRVETIPYGIDLATFSRPGLAKTAAKLRLELELEKPIILCPAAAVAYKRIQLAVEAVAMMDRGSLLHLGKGPLAQEIEKQGVKKLGKKRFRSTVVSPEVIPEFYAAADLVTLSSTAQENSTMVFLEAMAASKFVVTTDAPRARWILGEAGVFTNPDNIDAYAEAINSTLKRKWGKPQQDQIEQFSWDKIGKMYENLLQDILKK